METLEHDHLLSLLQRARKELEKALKLAGTGKHTSALNRLQAMDELIVSAVLAFPADVSRPYQTLLALLNRIIRSASGAQQLEFPSGDANRTRRNAPSRQIQEAIEHLRKIADAVGPREPGFVFDPAAFRTIAHVIATALFAQTIHSLSSVPDELGSGIYTLFYTGPLSYYSPIRDKDVPIYVGSAIPAKYDAKSARRQGTSISARLTEHRKTILSVQSNHETGNLEVANFKYRYLVVRSGWELAAEQYLIRHFRPVWNKETKICSGFGKHGDASVTRANVRSPWDVLHPGRRWATTEAGSTPDEITDRILAHFDKYPPRPIEIGDILHG